MMEGWFKLPLAVCCVVRCFGRSVFCTRLFLGGPGHRARHAPKINLTKSDELSQIFVSTHTHTTQPDSIFFLNLLAFITLLSSA
jgi:hypothetical protein